MSAFKPFVHDANQHSMPQSYSPRVINPSYHPLQQQQQQPPQQQQQQQQKQQQPSPLFQPIHKSYCASSSNLPRHSPDNGYVSLEHPSRSASYVSQSSMQFSPGEPRNNGGMFDPASSTPGRSQTFRISSLDGAEAPSPINSSYRSSVSSNYNNSWTSKNFLPRFGQPCTPPRRQDDQENPCSVGVSRQKQCESVPRQIPFSASWKDRPSKGDLRHVLLIKETELRMVRETMIKNETAIMQVVEEKKKKWQAEMSDRKKEWENQLQTQQNKSWKTEQLLQFQVAKLHQENKRLQAEMEELKTDKQRLADRCHNLERELESIKADMQTIASDASIKEVDLVTLMNQLATYGEDKTDRCKTDSNHCSAKRSSSSQNISISSFTYSAQHNTSSGTDENGFQTGRQHPDGEDMEKDLVSRFWSDTHLPEAKTDVRNLTLPDLQKGMENSREELEASRMEFDRQRRIWNAEKEKVIEYQKRLQLCYLQALHRNRVLELDVQQLTAEMAANDIKQLSLGREDTSSSMRTPERESVY